MLLSKFIRVIPYDNQKTLLYNSVNGALLAIEGNALIDKKNISPKYFTEGSIEVIKSYGFFDTTEKVYQELDNKLNSIANELTIIVEVTRNCNLSCSYCYQTGEQSPRVVMSYNILNSIVKYLSNINYKDQNIHRINLEFIGGEPLLEQDKIIYLYNEVYKICHERNIELIPSINTNGTLINVDFLKKFHAMKISVTLSLE